MNVAGNLQLEGGNDRLTHWRVRLLNRLLSYQIALSAIGLALTVHDLYPRLGPSTLVLGGSALAVICAVRLGRNETLKLVASVGSFGGTCLFSVYMSGMNGVGLSFLESGLILATLFLERAGRVLTYALLGGSYLFIAGLQTAKILPFHVVDPSRAQTWFNVIALSVPGIAVVLMAQSGLMGCLTDEARRNEESAHALLEESLERDRAQQELDQANELLETAVVARTRDLERVGEELAFFSDLALTRIVKPLEQIREGVCELKTLLDGGIDREVRKLLARSDFRIAEMVSIVKDLHSLGEVSKSPIGRTIVDVSKLSEDLFAELRERSPSRQVHTLVAPGISVNADPGLVRSALRNVIENAWKFTGDVPDPRIEIRGWSEGDRSGVMVCDNGPGIGSETLKELVRPFRRGDMIKPVQGSGIGLSTVKRIVDRHGGSIRASSGEHGGAAFSLEFGEAESVRASVPHVVEPPAEPETARAILAGEDWKRASLRTWLISQLFVFGFTAIELELGNERFPLWLSVTLVALLAVYPLALLTTRSKYKSLATVGLIPTTVISGISMIHAVDFSLAAVLTFNSLCFAALYFGRSAVVAVGSLIAASAVYGFAVRTQVNGAILFPAHGYALFLTKGVLVSGLIAILVLALRTALDNLQVTSAATASMEQSLLAAVETRTLSLQAAERLRDQLDATVARRTLRLKDEVEFLSHYTGAIAHDLRSPIGVLRELIEMVGQDAEGVATPDAILKIHALSAQVSSLSVYLEQLISLARQLQSEPLPEQVDLRELALTESAGKYQVDAEERLDAFCDPHLFALAISCLFSDFEKDPSKGMLALRRTPSGIEAEGLSESFVESVRACIQAQPQPLNAEQLPSLAPLALVRVCRRLGCGVVVKDDRSIVFEV